MRTLQNRIETLERQSRNRGDGLVVVRVTGGLPAGSHPIFARAGGHVWTQQPDDSDAAFKTRTTAAARAARAPILTIGGLPPSGYDLRPAPAALDDEED